MEDASEVKSRAGSAKDKGWLETPPASPFLPPLISLNYYDELPALATNEQGMLVNEFGQDEVIHATTAKVPPKQRKRRKFTKQTSEHFKKPVQAKEEGGEALSTKRKARAQLAGSDAKSRKDFGGLRPKSGNTSEEDLPSTSEDGQESAVPGANSASRKRAIKQHVAQEDTPPLTAANLKAHTLATPPTTPAKPPPILISGLNLDDLSSDSSLTSLTSSIGPSPFPPTPPPTTKLLAIKTKKRKSTKSPYFPHPHKQRPHFLSCLPFPPLSTPRFGLMQERLAHYPFRLLIATIFLNKTPGARAMPVFFDLMAAYPSPTDLAAARAEDITAIIQKLGFQNQRARKIVALARVWVERPPEKGKRYAKRDYPRKGDGRGVGADEILDDDDERVAWEIGHLPGLGAYAHDSWRMFCRDQLRGLSMGWNGSDSECVSKRVDVQTQLDMRSAAADDVAAFEPEWKRVLPLDKELRAWMTWMWLKEGWVWNKETGERTRASGDLMQMASGGGVVTEVKGEEQLGIEAMPEGVARVEVPAGEFL